MGTPGCRTGGRGSRKAVLTLPGNWGRLGPPRAFWGLCPSGTLAAFLGDARGGGGVEACARLAPFGGGASLVAGVPERRVAGSRRVCGHTDGGPRPSPRRVPGGWSTLHPVPLAPCPRRQRAGLPQSTRGGGEGRLQRCPGGPGRAGGAGQGAGWGRDQGEDPSERLGSGLPPS